MICVKASYIDMKNTDPAHGTPLLKKDSLNSTSVKYLHTGNADCSISCTIDK